jgi:hypothetical protein
MTFSRPVAIAVLAVLCFSSAVRGQFAGYGSSAAYSGSGTMRYDPNDPRLGYCLKNDCFAGQGPYAHLQCLPLSGSWSFGMGSGGVGYGGGYGNYGGGQDCCGACCDGHGGSGGCGGAGCGTAGYGTPGYVKSSSAGKSPEAASPRKAASSVAVRKPAAVRNVGYRYKF